MQHLAPQPARPSRLIEWLIASRWVLLVAALATAAMCYPATQNLHFDREIENMYARDDPVLAPYRKLRRIFGTDEAGLVVYDDKELLTPEGMQRLELLTAQLEAVPGVQGVFSLSRSPVMGQNIIVAPWRERFYDLSEGLVLGPGRQTAGVVCMLEPEETSGIPRGQTIDAIRALLAKERPNAVLTGEPVMLVDGFRYLHRDGHVLGWSSSILLMIVIGLLFRSIRWMIAPMIVVRVTLWWTQGALYYGDFRLTMISSMLWAIVTVIGIATVVHLIVRFRDAQSEGLAPRQAFASAAALLAAPITWAILTDAVGFGSLLISRVGPVYDFGAMMIVGSLLVLPAIGMVVPAMALWMKRDAPPPMTIGQRQLNRSLSRLSYLIEHRPRLLGGTSVALAVLAGCGVYRLDVQTDFTRNFRASTPLVKAYDVVETRLGGAGMWDILIPLPEQPQRDLLDRVRRLEARLRSEVVVTDDDGNQRQGITKAMSVADIIDVVPGGSLLGGATLPMLLGPLQRSMPLVGSMYGTDPDSGQQYLRVMLRSHERQSAPAKRQLIEQVTRITREEFPEAEVTGVFVLLTGLIESISRDQWTSFAAATIGIGLMMVVALRSVKLAVAALVPNALPILVVTGLLGWLGLKINMGAAMIAAVSMGLAVDSSIHYIISFQRQRAAGMSVRESLAQVQLSVGRAMVLSTLALIAGFSTLCLSNFVPTVYFGVLVSLTMFGGLAGNLVLLPLLLMLLERD